METAASLDDGVAAFNEERRHEQRLQEQRDGACVRGRTRVTGPGTEAGMRHRSTVVMGGRFRVGMSEHAGDREDGENEIEASQRGGQSDGGFRHTHHGTRFCNACTAVGASHSRGPTARPINTPCWSMNTVVGNARTR